MSVFGGFSAGQVVDAAERYIAKMDDGDLAAGIVQCEPAMMVAGRRALVESIFDAFRERGESSEDVAEGAGAPLSSIEAGDATAISSLLQYAQRSPGLLKEATSTLVKHHGEHLEQLSPALVDGIAKRLRAQ
ncbi:MAG: hypothetical protein ACREP1_03350 [Rhodanobacteraceae bacterium]